ncbi:MAG: ATP-binding protein [Bdellovibrionota bacterium]
MSRCGSVQRSLLIRLLAATVLLCGASGIATYTVARRFTNSAFDSGLVELAVAIAANVKLAGDGVTVDLPQGAISAITANLKRGVSFRVVDRTGVRIRGDLDLPPPAPGGVTAVFSDAEINSRKLRVVTIHPSIDPSGLSYVQVAEEHRARSLVIGQGLFVVLAPQIALVLFGLVLMHWGVQEGLKSLNIVSRAVRSRSTSDLRPFEEESAPPEVRPLVHAINDLLRRVQQDVEAQRRFIANASHQIRTPLAGLKMQTELALREHDREQMRKFLAQADRSADRLIRLTKKLLLLARVEPSAREAERHEVRLDELAAEVTADFVQAAATQQLDLGFEGQGEVAVVRGDPIHLRELIGNLVENAIQYSPPGGAVTVALSCEDGRVNISVTDDGPGIPPEEREKVCERFYRVEGTGGSGSGLGLAIVREIVEAHHAELSIRGRDPERGTVVEVRFASSGR